MDISMPGMDGIQATRQIVARDPTAVVVMLTSFANEERVDAALDAGAVGYILKECEPDKLVCSIKAAARGESPTAARLSASSCAQRAPHRCSIDAQIRGDSSKVSGPANFGLLASQSRTRATVEAVT